MMHTFLFEPGIWTAAGTFWSADGKPMSAEGRTEITHRPECWLLSGSMRVLCSPPVEFVNAYSIEPPSREGAALKWTSENPALGKLHGTFSVVGPCILSVYRCEEAGYVGAEHLAQVDPRHYDATGVLLLDDRRLSSWRVVLTRQLMLAALAAAWLLQAVPAHAQSMRCGNSLIEPGATMSEVLKKCGEPQSRMQITEPVRARRPNGTTYVVGTTTSEVWRYDRGYGKFPVLLTFAEGTLERMEFER